MPDSVGFGPELNDKGPQISCRKAQAQAHRFVAMPKPLSKGPAAQLATAGSGKEALERANDITSGTCILCGVQCDAELELAVRMDCRTCGSSWVTLRLHMPCCAPCEALDQARASTCFWSAASCRASHVLLHSGLLPTARL